MNIDYNKEEQRYGRNKSSIVNHTYINSGEYRRKFDKITDVSKVNQILYQKAKEMLMHRSGTLLEDMYWFDGETGEVIACVLDAKEEQRVIYPKSVTKQIRDKRNLIAMHTHPLSMPPSIADFNSIVNNDYQLGIVLCHDGKIYVYKSSELLSENLQKLYIAFFLKKGYNEDEAQEMSLRKLQENYRIEFWEVS